MAQVQAAPESSACWIFGAADSFLRGKPFAAFSGTVLVTNVEPSWATNFLWALTCFGHIDRATLPL